MLALIGTLGALLALGGSPPEPQADEPGPAAAPTDADSPRSWHVGGMVDVAYAINSNIPANHVNRGHATAARTNAFALNYVNAYLLHAPDEREPWQLELALQAGSNVEATYGGEPAGDYVGVNAIKHIGLANAGMLSPWGHERGFSTKIAAGLFSSPITVGSYWSKDSWNYASSWGNSATPYYLMGANLTQSLGHKVAIAAWVVNGWQIVGENNHAPAYVASLTLAPLDGLSIGQHTYFGPEHTNLSPHAWRVSSDTQVVYDTGDWGVAAYGDYGQELRTDLEGRPVHQWAGGALLARARVMSWERAFWEMGLRPEFWWESHGTFFGAEQTLVSVSYTNSVQLFDYVMARVEYRYDHSTAANGFFYVVNAVDADDDLASNQHTVFLSLVGMFDHAFATGAKTHRSK